MEKLIVRYMTFILVFITLAVFYPTFNNGFQLSWDDQWQVLDYKYVTNHSLSELLYHFTHFHLGQYFPVNTLLYIAIYKLWGFDPIAFHAVCFIIHIINVLLLFFILRTTINTVKPIWTESRVNLFAFLTAVIFAVHPLQVESVAWISASKIVLYAMFFLLGIWFYLRYLKTMSYWHLLMVILLYLLSFGSKEQAIIFPLNLIAFDYLFGRYKGVRFSFSGFSQRVIVEKIPFLLIAINLYLFSSSNNLGVLTENTYPLYQRAMFGMSSFMEYLFRFITPVKLYYYYFFPIVVGEKLPLYYWGMPLLVLICGAFVYDNYRKGNKIVVFGFLVFIINLLLVLHIIPMPRNFITADRYMYFSIIGVGAIVAWLFIYAYTKKRKWRKALITVFSVWILLISVQSNLRTREWKDSDSVKKNVTEQIEKLREQHKNVVNNPLEINQNDKE
jgi:protein O-mannosyl-transferase